MKRELVLSARDKKLFGVCGGWAAYLNGNSTIVRVVSVALTLISSGLFIVIYLIAALVTPKETPSSFDDHFFHSSAGSFGRHSNGTMRNDAQQQLMLQQIELIQLRLDRIETEIQAIHQKQRG